MPGEVAPSRLRDTGDDAVPIHRIRRRAGGILLVACLSAGLGCAPRQQPSPAGPPAEPAAAPLAVEAAILRQEDRREPASVRPLLSDPSPAVRARAALALGRIGDLADLPALAASLRDPDAGVRATAAFALGLLGSAEAAAPLREALGDPSPAVRERAAFSYGRLPAIRDAAPLVSLLAGQRGEDAIAALLGLWRLQDPAALDAVLERTLDPDPALRAAAASCLMRMVGPVAVGATPVPGGTEISPEGRARAAQALIRLTADPEETVRESAARGLGGPDLPGAAPALERLLRDPSWRVQVNALRSLGAIRRGFDPERLAPALAHDNPNVRLAALQALPGIEGAAVLADGLEAIEQRGEPALRAAAATALAAWGGEAFLEHAAALALDFDAQVRVAAAAILGRIPGPEAERRLRELLGDAHPAVAVAALQALAGRDGADRGALALAALAGRDFSMRAEGVALLPKDSPGIVPTLIGAWLRARGDAQNDVRLAALDALADLPGEEASRAAEGIFREDADWLVRRRAAEVLRRRGVPGNFDAGPVETGRDIAYYEAAARLEATKPRIALVTTRGRIVIGLLPAEAPLTVASFLALVSRGYFDAQAFHRVVPNFVVQGGDPHLDGNGGPGYQIRCEINRRRYGRGTVGMALSGKDTGGSQFFITHTPQPHLDGGYTVFGEVIEGMDVVDRIVQGDVVLEARAIEEVR